MTALDNDPRTDSDDTPFFLNGNFAPVFERAHRCGPEGDRARSRRHSRAATCATAPTRKSGTAGHWFFGDGMVHGVRLDGGKAEWYRNRFVQTTKLEKGLEATDPEAMFDPTASAANTHVLAHAGRIWALEEGHLPYELSPELDTLGYDDFGGKLTTAFTAHPKLCPETGELHFFGYSPLPPFLDLPRPRRERRARALGADRGPAGHDDARLHDHPRPRDLHGPARGVQPREPRRLRSAGTTTTAPASASCRGWAPTPTFAGSRSTRATSSTP